MAVHAPFARSDERWLGGVSAGLAHRLGIDPALIRSLFLLCTLVGGFGLILYGLGWLLLPDAQGEVILVELFRGRPQSSLVGASVMLVLGASRPFSWFYGAAVDGSDTGYMLYLVSLLALLAATVLTVAALILARRAARRRSSLAQPAVSTPVTETIISDGVPLPPPGAVSLDTPTIAIDSVPTEPLRKTWFSRGTDVMTGPRPTPVSPPPPPRPTKPRRPKAGSRHVQLTLAASFLAIAAIAVGNNELSIRSIGQACGATAIIWGASVAVAAARGRRAAGTSIMATLAVGACAVPLAVASVAPAATLTAPIDPYCGQASRLGSTTCAYTERWSVVDDGVVERILEVGEPLVLTNGIGQTSLSIATEEPLIITVTGGISGVSALLPGWELEQHGSVQILDAEDSIVDITGTEHFYPSWYRFRLSEETLVLTSPGAVPGEAAEIRIETGSGDVSLSTRAADTEIGRVHEEVWRLEDEMWNRKSTEESEAIETDDASESTAELTDETGTDEVPADEGATE